MSKRKTRLQKLEDNGYSARIKGQPCVAPTARELERAAWEIGWRAANSEIAKKVRK